MAVNYASSFLKLWKAKVACKHESSTDHQQAAKPRYLPADGYVGHKQVKEWVQMPGERCMQREEGRALPLEGGPEVLWAGALQPPWACPGFTPTTSQTAAWVEGNLTDFPFQVTLNFPLCCTSETKVWSFFNLVLRLGSRYLILAIYTLDICPAGMIDASSRISSKRQALSAGDSLDPKIAL